MIFNQATCPVEKRLYHILVLRAIFSPCLCILSHHNYTYHKALDAQLKTEPTADAA